MRLATFFVLAILSGSSILAQEKDDKAEAEIGTSLVDAIAANDIVAYSQCWGSLREAKARMKEHGVNLPPKELQGMQDYIAQRNRNVAKSFRKIQGLLDDRKIARKSIEFKSCEAKGLREQKTPQGSLKGANGFTVVFTVGQEDWKFDIDDGSMIKGLWYFTDSPTSLQAGDEFLSFNEPLRKKE